jgi:hypothetical protein
MNSPGQAVIPQWVPVFLVVDHPRFAALKSSTSGSVSESEKKFWPSASGGTIGINMFCSGGPDTDSDPEPS